MAAPVSDDPDKALVAARLKQLLRDRGYTHQSFAAELEVSPGLVSQWATNRGAVPPERALAVGNLLGVPPEEISPTWRVLRDQFLSSQIMGFDAATIARAVELVRDARSKMDLPYAGPDKDPELFAEMLKLAILEPREREGDERRVRAADRQGSGITGSASKEETRTPERPAAGRRKHA